MSINDRSSVEGTSNDGYVVHSESTPLLENAAGLRRDKGASFASSSFNLMNAIMGSGILGLSYAMASTGIIGFSILLVLVSSLAAYSVHLLLTMCGQTGVTSYEDLGDRVLRKPGKIMVGCTILIQNIGAMSSYMFILKSELPASISCLLSPDSTGDAWYEGGRTLLVLITLCVVLPLALLPRIGFLGYTSGISFLFKLYFTVVVVVKWWSIPCPLPHNVTIPTDTFKISNSSDTECTPKLFAISTKSAYVVPTMAFSFLCHTAVLPIYCELHRPSKKRMQNVTIVSIVLSFLVYLISALFGYLTFYGQVNSELLLSYDSYMPRDIMIMTVRLATLLAVLTTVPIIHFPARKAVISMLYGDRPFSWLTHVLSTLVILGVVLLLAVFVPDIMNVFGLVGATTSTCLLFIYPGIFYLKLSDQSLSDQPLSDQPLRSLDSVGAVILLVVGLFVGGLSLSIIIVSWVQDTLALSEGHRPLAATWTL